MRSRLLVPVSIALMLVVGGCGGSSNTSEPTSTTPTTVASDHVAAPVSANPSKSAKMICESEAKSDIYESATGVKTTSITSPTWNDQVYSCDYLYRGGVKIRLSVKELSNEAETTEYYESLERDLDKKRDVPDLGQAFQTDDGSIVVRKDYKVLTVDVSGLPDEFGLPSAPRGDVAINVAFAVMGCWTGE